MTPAGDTRILAMEIISVMSAAERRQGWNV